MIPPNPELLIACACGRLLGRSPNARSARNPRDSNLPFIRTAPDDERANMRFVNQAGYWAHYDFRTGDSSWPLPQVDTAQALASFAQRARILFEEPRMGDLVLVWSPALNRYGRVSIVAAIDGVTDEGPRCLTLGPWCRSAWGHPERFSPATGDRFLRWTNLERPTFAPTYGHRRTRGDTIM